MAHALVESNELTLDKWGQMLQPLQSVIMHQLETLQQEVNELKNLVAQAPKKRPPTVMSAKVYNLPSSVYALTSPIDVTVEIHDDEVLAVMPDLELYGEGSNQIEALNDFKAELLDLYHDLHEMDDAELGDAPKAWKKTLQQLITVCR